MVCLVSGAIPKQEKVGGTETASARAVCAAGSVRPSCRGGGIAHVKNNSLCLFLFLFFFFFFFFLALLFPLYSS